MRGRLLQAAAIGNRAAVPLGVPRGDVALGAVLSAGQQAPIHSAMLRGQPVAVKKARIGTHQARKLYRLSRCLALVEIQQLHHRDMPIKIVMFLWRACDMQERSYVACNCMSEALLHSVSS